MSDEKTVAETPTEEIVLESGHKVKIRTSISARTYLKLKNFAVSKMKMKNEQNGYDKKGSPKMQMTPSFDGEDLVGIEEETVKAYLVSFNDDVSDPYNKMIDTLGGREYEQVKSKVDEAYEKEQKK